MPNIELHGYDAEEAHLIQREIRTVLGSSPEAHEIVTTVFPSIVENLDSRKTPFLRIICSADELDDLVTRLEPLNQDIEVLPLARWIPKRA